MEREIIELNGERIIKIKGTAATNYHYPGIQIVTIEFHTHQGRKFGPYGKENVGKTKQIQQIGRPQQTL